MADKTLIFIPDISGFTEFVNQTEINHSRHIISELLEIIINANELDLEISEIEGDAVLFYRFGDPPKLEMLLNQAKKMFVDFHYYLKVIERDNVCQCGACTTASNLTLKFVTHIGEIQLVKIHTFQKLIGKDVILAHRLLKNTVKENEYILVTADYLDSVQPIELPDDSFSLLESIDEYESFGKVKSNYATLSHLHNSIAIPEKKKYEVRKIDPLNFSVIIKAPIQKVHQYLTDTDLKLKYTQGLRKIEADSKINRVNSGHVCYLDGMTIEFKTVDSSVLEGKIQYVEHAQTSIGIAYTSEFNLTENNGSTELELNLYPEILDNISQEFQNQFFSGFDEILQNFKLACEKED